MTALTTEALADGLGLKPQTLRAAICRHSHYYGIRPAKLPNGRLLWPADTIARLTAGLTDTPPASRAGFVVGGRAMQQMTLMDAPPLMPTMPPAGLSMRCLRVLLSGRPLDCETFYQATGSMRLAAYVEVLHRLGWPILTDYQNRGASRNLAVYALDLEALAEVMALLNAHLGTQAESVQ